MNRAICVNTWRQFKSNNVRLILLTLMILLPLGGTTLMRCNSSVAVDDACLSPPFIATLFTLLWGIGVIGCERQHGTISLVLSRPVSISRYVFSKWFAVSIAASICSVQALLIEQFVSVALSPSLMFNTEFVANGLERVLLCFSTASVLVFFSSLVTGIKDLALIAGVLFAGQLIRSFFEPLTYNSGRLFGLSQVPSFITNFYNACSDAYCVFLYPNIPVADILNGSAEFFTYLINYTCVITVSLSMAIFFLSRKEYSYAHE
ncbi:MAG: ABC transporter permease [Candidatus Melainabacteria bacterium]|nr:ABC transporter permease [Candidatus Melainabacteria bacterium]